MLLLNIGSPSWALASDPLPPAHRRFLMAAIRAALVKQHPELRAVICGRADDELGAIEMNLDPIIALAQQAVIVTPAAELKDLLDENVCPRCIYNPPTCDCELRSGSACMLRRYGSTVFDAAKHALLTLAAGVRPDRE